MNPLKPTLVLAVAIVLIIPTFILWSVVVLFFWLPYDLWRNACRYYRKSTSGK